jgi:hypothetical protein
MPKRLILLSLLIPLAILVTSSLPSPALAIEEIFTAKLRSANETPLSLATTGTGIWAGQLDPTEASIAFTLAYFDLEGGTVTAAHIHFGQAGITGGIVIHFCGTGGKPACPGSPGTVTGVVTAADVVAATPQNVGAGDFAKVIRALRRGDAYVNVHTTTFPGGEIRGQVR